MLNHNDDSHKTTSEMNDSANIENMSKEELWAGIEEILNAADGDHIDIDKLELYHEQLQKIDPVMPEYSAQKAMSEYEANFPELFETDDVGKNDGLDKTKNIKGRSFFKRLSTIAAVVTIILVMTPVITGRNPIQMIFDWGNEIFTVSGPGSGTLEVPPKVDGDYRTFRDVVNSISGKEIACPTWVPSDYSSTS